MKHLQHITTEWAQDARAKAILALEAVLDGDNQTAAEHLAYIAGGLTTIRDLCIQRDARKKKPRPPKAPKKDGESHG